jgi:hypothetical protein
MTDKSNPQTPDSQPKDNLFSVEGIAPGVAAINNFFNGMSPTEAAVAGAKGIVLLTNNGEPAPGTKPPEWLNSIADRFPAEESFSDATEEPIPQVAAPQSKPAAPKSFVDGYENEDTAKLEAQIAIAQTATKVIETEEARFNRVRERLNVTEDEVTKILDTLILEQGTYFKIMTLLPGSKRNPRPLVAIFKTRTVSDYRLINDALGVDQPVLETGVDMSTTRANMIASIVYFGRLPDQGALIPEGSSHFYDIPHKKRLKTVQETTEWVNSLNQSLFSMIADALSKFDQIIMLSTSEYAMRSFL